MSAPELEEVDTVMHSYSEALAAKDEDIFKLHEHNKRMRALVQETLKARENLELHSRSQSLLISSLEMELHEKKCLITAQDEETNALREGIAELHVLLDCPSELDVGPKDMVSKVECLVKEQAHFKCALAAAQQQVTHYRSTVLDILADEETRQRRTFEDTACLLHPPSFAWLCREQLAIIGLLESAMTGQQHIARQERAELLQQLQLSTERFTLEARQSAERAEATRTELAAFQVRAAFARLEALEERGRASIALETIQCVAERAWGPWCVALQRHSRAEAAKGEALGRAAKDLVSRLETLKVEHAGALSELETAHSTERRLQKQLKRLEGQAEELAKTRSALEELRLRHEKSAERLLKMQQHHRASVQATTAALHERETQLQEATRKADRLVQQNTILCKDIKALEKRVEALTKRTRFLESQCQELAEEKQTILCDGEAKATTMEREIRKLEQEYEAQFATEKTRFENQLKELEGERNVWKERHHRCQSEHAAQKQTFGKEIREWASLTETLKRQLAEARAQLERESTARKVLESTRRAESGLLSRLLVHSSIHTPDTSRERSVAAGEAKGGQDGSSVESTQAMEVDRVLRGQVELLERSCRQSAAVISELREALFRARMDGGSKDAGEG